jgi:hypothetical protein
MLKEIEYMLVYIDNNIQLINNSANNNIIYNSNKINSNTDINNNINNNIINNSNKINSNTDINNNINNNINNINNIETNDIVINNNKRKYDKLDLVESNIYDNTKYIKTNFDKLIDNLLNYFQNENSLIISSNNNIICIKFNNTEYSIEISSNIDFTSFNLILFRNNKYTKRFGYFYEKGIILNSYIQLCKEIKRLNYMVKEPIYNLLKNKYNNNDSIKILQNNLRESIRIIFMRNQDIYKNYQFSFNDINHNKKYPQYSLLVRYETNKTPDYLCDIVFQKNGNIYNCKELGLVNNTIIENSDELFNIIELIDTKFKF